MSKGSKRRPGKGYEEAFEKIFGKPTASLEQQLSDAVKSKPKRNLDDKRARFIAIHSKDKVG